MFTIKYGIIKNGHFHQSLNALMQERLPLRAAYNASKALKAISKEMKNVQELYVKKLKEFATLDEKGEFVLRDKIPNTFIIPDEKQKDFEKAMEEFGELDLEIQVSKIKFSEIESLKLSPKDMVNLEPILDPEEKEESKNG